MTVTDREIVELASKWPTLERKAGKNNWLEHVGGLPKYIDDIARALHYERGMTISRAIATAVERVRKWASGRGDVKVDTRAKAAKAVAEWEAKKKASKAKTAAKAATKAVTASVDLSEDSDPETYTKPKLRDRLKSELLKSSEGGKSGEWSARKSQLLAQRYEARGGGYRGPKSKSQKDLSKWTGQNWRTRDGDSRARQPGGATKRYLPDSKWRSMTDSQGSATYQKKRKESKKGRQHVPNTKKAKVTASRKLDVSVIEAQLVSLGMSQAKAGLISEEILTLAEGSGGWWLVYYKNRSTPDVIRDGDKPKQKEGYGKIIGRKRPGSEDLKKIHNVVQRGQSVDDNWITTRYDGKSSQDPGAKRSSYRPKLAAKQKTKG